MSKMFAGGGLPAGRLLPSLLILGYVTNTFGAILTPPYFNLAEGRRISATATCGEDTQGPELYCKLVGANADRDANINLIQGQVCDYCDPSRPDKMHPPEFAVDGDESWWQSPPLSRGMKYNEVNLTIDLGQEFHVAYVFIKMANSPRPGVWVLERSLDNGATYQPWQYFADTLSDCETFFGSNNFGPISSDDSVVCETQYSKVVPLEGGEIVVSLLNNRPSANDFFNSSVLQEWTRATNIRLRFLRTKTLLGHLMSVARQDPTVTRRYFYSIKDISIGGRCVCNGHADTCDITDPNDPYKLLCRCQHNTCGANCDSCCPGFEQKAWRLSKSYEPFICERCNCFGHSEHCVYDSKVDEEHRSLDLNNRYEGGGVCQNCRDHTEGVNCNRCTPGYYRPYGKSYNETDVCQRCNCEFFYSTGNCAEETGKCECRPEFTAPNCDSCSYGHFGYPECRPCECHLNGTRGEHCEAQGGQCPCKQNYGGKFCNQCAEGFYNFPACLPCACNIEGSLTDTCHIETGQCSCKNNFRNRTCSECGDGYFNYPDCAYCSCDVRGTEAGVCNKATGQCLCKEGYGGERCDQCIAGYFAYPNCKPCACSETGSASTICDATGKCTCLYNFAGRTCDQCSPGYYQYPECLSCKCDSHGAIGVSCDAEGNCKCRDNFDGNRCNQCKEGFYNFPACEDCNCDPTGVLATFGGCGTLPAGELCQCKDHVEGRICNKCKPLFWNLQASNPEGCEACDCYQPGVMGGLGICAPDGQCTCKPYAISRRCDQCADGSYNLQEDNLFGCTDCNCDIGGSVDDSCNKETGQCYCRPRVSGQTCSEPLQTHYFPTLYQYQYEAEDGRTPANTPVRYGFDQAVFPGYSWKGYAVFSQLQNEVIQDIYITKPSLYRMILRYVNRNQEPINGVVTITPDSASDVEQKFVVSFKPSDTPTLVTVSGATGGIASPMVMNPGRWTISIKNEKSLFLDYFVLLPAAFYEATILVEQVDRPCEIGNLNMCRQFGYPNLTRFDTVRGDGGFRPNGDQREPLTEFFTDEQQLREVEKSSMPLINNNQPEIHFNLQVTKPGPHILIINYLTPANDKRKAMVNVEASSQKGRTNGKATLYPCTYTSLCPQAVIDKDGNVALFKFDTNFISVVIKGENDSNVAIDSIIAVPQEEWSEDYQKPKSVCVSIDGKCIQEKFVTPPESKKIEFELEGADQKPTSLPGLIDNTTQLIYLDGTDPMIDIVGKVPHPGQYVFIVHYYQPDHPEFDLDVLVHNGQVYEAKLPIEHCPSKSGCRSIVAQANQNDRFALTENFVFTLKDTNQKGVWLDSVLVIPAEQYTENVLEKEPVDHTGAFITECGTNHFNIDTSSEGFCRDSVFSLTADYNNGALPCGCDFDGSLSFTCDKFGGQCQCKPNVIGRRCEACKTGYFGFPDCRACDCPSTALCETNTGACICPPRVTGERCDQCEPMTYGFDQIIGCEECNCEWLGVLRGNLQCDLLNGSCQCKENVVGRTCDRCQPGNWAYPNCQLCDCDLRGTTPDICDQYSAECFCKKNVEGQACDLCKPGTFNIEEKNAEGCTKCFCSGKTSRCSSSSTLYKSTVTQMEDWTLATVVVESTVMVKPLSTLPTQLEGGFGADLTLEEAKDNVVFFAAPENYLGNKLTSYGGAINYTVYYTIGDDGGKAVASPDVIIYSGDIYLLHFALEQPPPAEFYSSAVDLIDTNFLLPNGFTASREQITQVLGNLEGILIRATYWSDSITTRLQDATLDIATEGYRPDAVKVLSVEQCQCPPNYKGLSCEECAPGYYRSATGPFGGFCVPCQCNGHSDECDVVTGICHDCKHDTMGDHCEQCAVGHHGNATTGTPMDCLICACPLPIASNNFATACEVSPHGDRISCDCIDGYYGARCESCATGFFGRPEIAGDFCQPCQCSGNINPDDPSSCDSVTGECLQCLNNTFGQACSLCSPGYFGDAITLKDCQSCVCDECGTKQCDSYNGLCECNQNVVGEKCDRCEVEHFGFSSCQGCQACNCQNASQSQQCDDNSGQCLCQPGVTGRTCDRCINGFWNYSPEGCVTCGCNTEYSLGFGCNPNNGQCECLPGVIGEKCDHCPYRWVLIPDDGCHECDSCTHNLLDVTDELKGMLDPIVEEFQSVAQGYFTTQRMTYINNTANQLAPQVNLLDPQRVDLRPITNEIESLEQDIKNFNRRTEYAVENAGQLGPKGSKGRKEAAEEEQLIKKAVDQARMTVVEVISLASNLESGTGQQIDLALAEAQAIIEEIKQRDFAPRYEETSAQLDKAEELLSKMKDFNVPVRNQTKAFERLRKKIKKYDDKIEDLRSHTKNSEEKAVDVNILNDQNKRSRDNSKVDALKNATADTEMNLHAANNILINASGILNEAKKKSDLLLSDYQGGANAEKAGQVNETIVRRELELQDIQDLVRKAENHATELVVRAGELDELLQQSRDTSNRGIGAANAYKNIVNGTKEALKAAKAASNAAENATVISEGLGDRTGESEQRSAKLLSEARQALTNAQKDLEPKMTSAKEQVAEVEGMNTHSNESNTIINKALDRMPATEGLQPLTEKAIQEAETANQITRGALERSAVIIDTLPDEVTKAKQVPKAVDDTGKKIAQANNQLDKVKNVVPNISNLISQISGKQEKQRTTGKDVEDQIRKLKERIAMARNLANRIKVGVTFSPNTVLQLKNPESLPLLGTSTRVSTYFKTDKPNGFLIYLGNEVGTQNKIRRATTDDFMALEIENGYPVLTIDLGSGAERIILNDKYVADDVWYQAIIDRTGKNVKLIIRAESEAGTEQIYEKEQVLKGTKSILNLDQEHSKLFVGGYSNSFDMQKDVKYSSFEGQMEELMVGDIPVSLWNFEDGANNNLGSKERDKLVNLQASTGFRFDGHGYAMLAARPYQMRTRSSIQLRFKTYAQNGLLFLAGKERSFVSIELKDGHVVYQYNLGHGLLTLMSKETHNNGRWHTVDAVRQGKEGLLKVDGTTEFQDMAPGTATELKISEYIYFGGYPQQHNFKPVTNIDFEGCIDGVQIADTLVDLSQNVQALGVIAGCPVRVASLVAFDESNPGYVRWPNATAPNYLQLNFKFKTTSRGGLLFYATNRDQTSALSLSLVDGGLVLKSNQLELVTSASIKYNDSEWHVVTATHSQDALRLDIDDYESFRSESAPPPLSIAHGSLYFGGVPDTYTIAPGTTPTPRPFIGCLGDATVNGVFINFANATDRVGAILGKCQAGEHTPVPPVRPPGLPITGDGDESEKPISPSPSPTPDTDRETDSEEENRGEGEPEETTLTPTLPTPAPTPAGMCSLPLYPATDPDAGSASGHRFGTVVGSRIEYANFPLRVKNKFDINLSFKTYSDEGILFYLADERHVDSITLYMKDGQIHYSFNCGSGAALLSTSQTYNDGEWHSAKFSRELKKGTLLVDTEEIKAESIGNTKTINVVHPIFIGGVAPNITSEAKLNMKGINGSFEGCIKDVAINSKTLPKSNVLHGVVPCSDKVERGVFFSADRGFIRARPAFRVGLNIDIKMDIKPRNVSGILMTVHSRYDYLALQMVNGAIKFSVDNGKGAISATFNPPYEHYFCDGQWHSIQAVKAKNVVTLSVDKIHTDHSIGVPGSSSTDTRHPLFIGGHPTPGRLRGLETREQYVGCMKNVMINDIVEKFTLLQAVGNVTTSVCPTI